ncbi:MAG: hypothetical protein JWQ40_750 [Segetibacter sp.]|jgi:hypothetical protein|nr:hypothetical protein [Segetibacter sp.]
MLLSGIILTDQNTWNYNLLFFATPSVLGWYYSHLLPLRSTKTFILLSVGVNLLAFIYFNIDSLHFFTRYNTYQYAIAFITLVAYCFLYFYYLLDNISEDDILADFNFWLSCGYLLYFLGAFIFILFYKEATSEQRGDMWASQNIILLFSALITFFGHLRNMYTKTPNDVT